MKSSFNTMVVEQMLAFTELDYQRSQNTTVMASEMYDNDSGVSGKLKKSSQSRTTGDK